MDTTLISKRSHGDDKSMYSGSSSQGQSSQGQSSHGSVGLSRHPEPPGQRLSRINETCRHKFPWNPKQNFRYVCTRQNSLDKSRLRFPQNDENHKRLLRVQSQYNHEDTDKKERQLDPQSRLILNKVLSVKSYRDLPNRLIISSPFCEKPLIAYGIIPYCKETQKWLLVKRRHSPEEIIMMRGSYRNAEIPRLLKGKSKKELLKDVETIANPNLFEERFRSTIGNVEKDLKYAMSRFEDAKDIIIKYLPQTEGLPDTEWLFPKGRMLTTYETPHRCALREFHEESGIFIKEPTESQQSDESGGTKISEITPKTTEDSTSKYKQDDCWNGNLSSDPIIGKSIDVISGDAYLVSIRPLIDSFRAANGRVYETRCWIYIFPHEITPPPILDLNTPGEIGDRRWVTSEEAKVLLSPSKYLILQTAANLIANTI